MKETLQSKVDNPILKRLEVLENLNKSLVDDKLFLEARIEKLEYIIGFGKPDKGFSIVNDGKIPLENLTLVERIKELEVLVEQLATGLNRQQSEFVTLRTFIGFNE